MAPLLFAGADYSAAKSEPNPTWLAVAMIDNSAPVKNRRLSIKSLENCGSSNLITAICSSSDYWGNDFTAIGLDFPFSYPIPFIKAIAPPGKIIDDSGKIDWIAAMTYIAQCEYSLIERTADQVSQTLGVEPSRLADTRTSPQGASPLHRINPGLRKMTWQGHALLCELRALGMHVLPFESGSSTALMEVYPAAMLKSLGLPYRKYKGATPDAIGMRVDILERLTRLHTVKELPWMDLELVIEPALLDIARGSDDALDAVIAALAATIAHFNKSLCAPDERLKSANGKHPGSPAEIDGWIYTPYLQTSEL